MGMSYVNVFNRLIRDQSIPWEMHTVISSAPALSPLGVLQRTLRWLLASMAAVVVTFGLLFMMHTLIETGETVIQKFVVAELTDFIRVRTEERVETRADKPKKIMPEEMPQMITPSQSLDQDAGAINIGYSVTGMAREEIDLSGLIGDFGSPDGEFLPLVRVAPMYPQRARVRGIEGWVELEFTITPTGTVADVRVTSSSHSIFETPAVRALEKFKYRPRIVNGQPVPVTDVKYRIIFTLEE